MKFHNICWRWFCNASLLCKVSQWLSWWILLPGPHFIHFFFSTQKVFSVVFLSKSCPVDLTLLIRLLVPIVLGIVTQGRYSETYSTLYNRTTLHNDSYKYNRHVSEWFLLFEMGVCKNFKYQDDNKSFLYSTKMFTVNTIYNTNHFFTMHWRVLKLHVLWSVLVLPAITVLMNWVICMLLFKEKMVIWKFSKFQIEKSAFILRSRFFLVQSKNPETCICQKM
jgi:hypothetical protein